MRTSIICLTLATTLGTLPGVAAADYFSLWTEGVALPGDGLPSSYIGDFDDDGQLELVCSDPGDATITQIRDLRTGQVEYSIDWGSVYNTPLDYCALDVDLDGNAEILIPGDGGFRIVDWLPAVNTPDQSPSDLGHAMGRARPNPFNPRTTIAFDLASKGDVDLSVYDASGRLVRRLVERSMEAGTHHAVWDGRSEEGRELASGTYFYELTVDGRRVASNKAVLLK